MSQGLEEPWGQLVSCEGASEDRFPILGDKFTIGRREDCDLVIANNKHISSHHCSLIRDENGDIWCKDTSTNGILVDGIKVKKEQVKLSDSQVIKVVFRKDSPKDNISYKFIDLRSTSHDTCESTLECTDVSDTCCSKDDEILVKRKLEDSTEESPPRKVYKQEKEKKEEKATPDEAPLKPGLIKKDSIEETLTCEICQEILHDCVSLQPCTHTYCGGCYSEWMQYSKECPACRSSVDRITKNFIVNNLVEAYLRANPGKRRPEEDLKELDEKNKITKDMLLTSSSGSTPVFSTLTASVRYPTHMASPLVAAPPATCRQCPGHVGAVCSTDSSSSSFTCTPGTTNHVLCMCCLLPMPDRRSDPDLAIPPQKCDICSKAFCHMYWGCHKIGCRGCLDLFKDINFDEAIMTTVICDNSYESRVLKNYLREKGLTMKDMIANCLDKLDNGTYQAPDTRTARISSSTRTCYSCAVKNLKELAFQYRSDISEEDLPGEVTGRPNCHWGRNCRTQVHNRGHAEKFNHICPQTKF